MSVGKILVVMLIAFGGGLMLLGGCACSGYNRVVTLQESVNGAWAEIDNQLKRRFDLIPNVVETVKGIASQEEKIYLGVAKAREAYFKAGSVSDKAAAATAVHAALVPMMRLQESYPALKSNEGFMRLHDDLAGTENRLAVARGRYNDRVRALNSYIRTLTGRLYASLAGVEKAAYFEVSEDAKAVPKVDFSGG